MANSRPTKAMKAPRRAIRGTLPKKSKKATNDPDSRRETCTERIGTAAKEQERKDNNNNNIDGNLQTTAGANSGSPKVFSQSKDYSRRTSPQGKDEIMGDNAQELQDILVPATQESGIERAKHSDGDELNNQKREDDKLKTKKKVVVLSEHQNKGKQEDDTKLNRDSFNEKKCKNADSASPETQKNIRVSTPVRRWGFDSQIKAELKARKENPELNESYGKLANPTTSPNRSSPPSTASKHNSESSTNQPDVKPSVEQTKSPERSAGAKGTKKIVVSSPSSSEDSDSKRSLASGTSVTKDISPSPRKGMDASSDLKESHRTAVHSHHAKYPLKRTLDSQHTSDQRNSRPKKKILVPDYPSINTYLGKYDSRTTESLPWQSTVSTLADQVKERLLHATRLRLGKSKFGIPFDISTWKNHSFPTTFRGVIDVAESSPIECISSSSVVHCLVQRQLTVIGVSNVYDQILSENLWRDSAREAFVVMHPSRFYWIAPGGNHRLCLARSLLSKLVTHVIDIRHVMYVSNLEGLWDGRSRFDLSPPILRRLVIAMQSVQQVNKGLSIADEYRKFAALIRAHFRPEELYKSREYTETGLITLKAHEFFDRVYGAITGGKEKWYEVAASKFSRTAEIDKYSITGSTHLVEGERKLKGEFILARMYNSRERRHNVINTFNGLKSLMDHPTLIKTLSQFNPDPRHTDKYLRTLGSFTTTALKLLVEKIDGMTIYQRNTSDIWDKLYRYKSLGSDPAIDKRIKRGNYKRNTGKKKQVANPAAPENSNTRSEIQPEGASTTAVKETTGGDNMPGKKSALVKDNVKESSDEDKERFMEIGDAKEAILSAVSKRDQSRIKNAIDRLIASSISENSKVIKKIERRSAKDQQLITELREELSRAKDKLEDMQKRFDESNK